MVQGESDAAKEPEAIYKERMHKLIEAFRNDLGNPELPFNYVQIGRFYYRRFRRYLLEQNSK
jgi:sialate O-acetylesterase